MKKAANNQLNIKVGKILKIHVASCQHNLIGFLADLHWAMLHYDLMCLHVCCYVAGTECMSGTLSKCFRSSDKRQVLAVFYH